MTVEIAEDIEMGPGLTKVNFSAIEDPINLVKVKRELTEMLSQSLQCWDAYKRLKYEHLLPLPVCSGIQG